MVHSERAVRDKQEELAEEGHRQKKAHWPLYEKFKAPDEGIVDFQFEPSFDRHAALLVNARTDVQRANLAIRLQQTYGNQYVQRLVESLNVQAKLTVSSPDDEYEREADQVAYAVTRASAPSVQRQAEEPEEEEPEEEEEEEEEGEERVQAKLSEGQPNMVSEDLEANINAARGTGQPLPDSIRTSLEPQLGHDFSQVHIHTDAKADTLSRQLSAEAFTTGNDVFFRDGAYQPSSDSGKKLIAHELTHVVQQSAVPVLQRQAVEAPATEEKGKGEKEGELTQNVYRFGVAFVDDGSRAKLQVGVEEEVSAVGEKKAEPQGAGPNVQSYGYSYRSRWAWEASTEWENGKPVSVEEAQEHALAAVDSAKTAIDKSELDEEQKKAAKNKLAEIRAQIKGCFTGRAIKPFVPATEEMVKKYYEQEMNKGEYAGIEYMNDKVEYKKIAGGPAKAPKAPEIDVKNPIVIDGYKSNYYDLPKVGEGRTQLERLCNLDPDKKKGIIIGHITGHTDIVPVTKPGPRFKSLEELSQLRVKSVVDRLTQAKLGPPEIIEGLGDSEAEVKDPTATEEERAKDRKVVVYWYWQQPKTP